MSEAPGATPRTGATRALRPRDAATLIIVDGASGEPRVLLGRRRADMVFMPGRYVFPGGRVDRGDRGVGSEDDLRPGELKRLLVAMKGQPTVARARGLALAAVRETFEEAGIVIGRPRGDARPPRSAAWRRFFDHGFQPALGRLTFFARAITPPGRPRRYDTRFFCVSAEAIAYRTPVSDGELVDLEWHSIANARSLELPNITRVVLEDLGERIASGALAQADAATGEGLPVPFYHRRNGTYRRDLIGIDM